MHESVRKQKAAAITPGMCGQGVTRTFPVAAAPTAAGLEKNDVSFLNEASGRCPSSFLLLFLLPLDLPVFFMAFAPGFLPAPARHPPLQPLVPTMKTSSAKRSRGKSKKSRSSDGPVQRVTCTPSDAHLKMEHDGAFYLEIR